MQLVPYIMFNGNCEEALTFYANALGGEIKDLSRYEGSPVESGTDNKQKVLNATMIAKGITVMAADSESDSSDTVKGGAVHLSIGFDNGEEEEKIFNALSEGASVTMPLQDTFWGARFGMLTDKFGIHWMFNWDKPQQ